MNVYFTEQGHKVRLYPTPVSEGGEGFIYKLQKTSKVPGFENLLAKIYKPETFVSEQKLLALKNIFKEKKVTDIAYPKELLYDKNKQCVGFLMPGYVGHCLWDLAYSPSALSKLKWTRRHLAELADKILDRFIDLHACGMLMADVNDSNILILKGSCTPVFVDVDSYQIADRYPCHVHFLEYTSPRILDLKGAEIYSQKDDEYYAIAVLLFKIFLVGRNPYSRRGEGSLERNLRNRDFVFPRGYDDNENMPNGPWQRIWYNLPYGLRNAFCNAFRHGNYLSPVQWKKVVREYISGLEDGSYPKVVFSKDNVQSIKKSILNLPSQEFTPQEIESRIFDNVQEEGRAATTEFLEFGSSSIRGFRNDSLKPHFLPVSCFDCLKNDGEMDLQLLETALKECSLSEWLSEIRAEDPPVTNLHVFGGALWRNLANRQAVLGKIREMTGINLGVMTLEEEAAVLTDACRDYDDGSGSILAVDLSGVSMFAASKEGESLSCWEYGDLGSKILSNWMFATSHIDTRLITKLEDHDQSIAAKMDNIRLSGSCTRLYGFGVIRELANKRKKQPGQLQIFTIGQLRDLRDDLTKDLVTNRTNVMVLYEDLYDNFRGRLARKLELRLSLSVYISLMENLHIDELAILPFNAGRAYVNYHSKHNTR